MVRRSDFDRHVAGLEARGGAALEPAVRQALLQPYLEERVLVMEARSRGLLGPVASPEQEREAVQKLLAEEVVGAVEVTEAEVERYFQEHTQTFRVPERVTLRQILVPTKNEARDMRRRVQKDSRTFDVLARTRSRSPEASTGGLMGVFSRGELPAELESAAFTLAPGETSEVVETSLGYHVLRVEERQAARDLPLEECRGRIHALLSGEKSDRGVREFVQDLLARAEVNHAAAAADRRPS